MNTPNPDANARERLAKEKQVLPEGSGYSAGDAHRDSGEGASAGARNDPGVSSNAGARNDPGMDASADAGSSARFSSDSYLGPESAYLSAPLAPRPRRRGVYLLPNLFTTGVLFAGFFAIVSAINGEFVHAAIAVYVAMVLDGLDGRVARLTHTQSEFGAQYDSLSDLVAFGLAPALIIYLWQLQDLGNPGWIAAFFYATATALRLARFNSRLAVADKRFFQGLPSPAGAALVVGMVWVIEDLGWAEIDTHWLLALTLVVALITGVLMVSSLAYSSFKDMDFRHRVPFLATLAVVGVLMVTALDPPKVLLAGFAVYALSGPLLALERWRRRWRRTNPA